jgi:hypothetical protein
MQASLAAGISSTTLPEFSALAAAGAAADNFDTAAAAEAGGGAGAAAAAGAGALRLESHVWHARRMKMCER